MVWFTIELIREKELIKSTPDRWDNWLMMMMKYLTAPSFLNKKINLQSWINGHLIIDHETYIQNQENKENLRNVRLVLGGGSDPVKIVLFLKDHYGLHKYNKNLYKLQLFSINAMNSQYTQQMKKQYTTMKNNTDRSSQLKQSKRRIWFLEDLIRRFGIAELQTLKIELRCNRF